MTTIAIIDSGGANIASLQFAIERLGKNALLTTNPDTIMAADRVLLPGVGSAKHAMDRLADADLIDLIRELTQPVLGICLGMQLLLEASEEEDVECLGILPGVATRLTLTPEHPVPNMGWCATHKAAEHPLLHDIASGNYFYYLHSYALPVADCTLATAEHTAPFSAVIGRNNFVATQFHPERSSGAGARLLKTFLVGAT